MTDLIFAIDGYSYLLGVLEVGKVKPVADLVAPKFKFIVDDRET